MNTVTSIQHTAPAQDYTKFIHECFQHTIYTIFLNDGLL